MTLYKTLYWTMQTTEQLRSTMFDTDLLDRERQQAKDEFIRRTTNEKIDDVFGRYA